MCVWLGVDGGEVIFLIIRVWFNFKRRGGGREGEQIPS
jgi:hypothetical protein